jgi:hypothetical protein
MWRVAHTINARYSLERNYTRYSMSPQYSEISDADKHGKVRLEMELRSKAEASSRMWS